LSDQMLEARLDHIRDFFKAALFVDPDMTASGSSHPSAPSAR